MAARGGKPTLEDVAAEAGVSRATVSRAINGGVNVSAEVMQRVEVASHRLGYQPNPAARSLVTHRTDMLAVVIPEASTALTGDPFFSRVLHGIGQRASAAGKQVLMMMRPDDSPEQLRHYLGAGHVDGAIIVSHHRNDEMTRLVHAAGIPIVFVGRPWTGDAAYADNQNEGGAYAVTRLLIDRGARRIATITGPQDMTAGLDRFNGWRRAMREAGLSDHLVAEGDFTSASGERLAQELLEREPGLEAIFAASDLMAVGALNHFNSRGVLVPEQVALAGFDDHELARNAYPPLTTVTNPAEVVGAKACDLLLRLLTGQQAESTIIASQVVARASAPSP